MVTGRRLRVEWHRATTAQLGALYPFHAETGLGARGVYLGTNETAGGSAFCFDPFELYTTGVLNAPNMLVLGEVGAGKSTAVKTFLYRTLGVIGPRRRRGAGRPSSTPKANTPSSPMRSVSTASSCIPAVARGSTRSTPDRATSTTTP